MDLVRNIEESQKGLTLRQKQEIEAILEKPDTHKYPVKNTSKISIGEFFASIEDKIKILKYLSTHPTMPVNDRQHIKESLE